MIKKLCKTSLLAGKRRGEKLSFNGFPIKGYSMVFDLDFMVVVPLKYDLLILSKTKLTTQGH